MGCDPAALEVAAGFLDERLAENFDAIDASTLASDFLGHSYYAESKSMLSDIYLLLKGIPVLERPLIDWVFLHNVRITAIARRD